MVETMKHVKKYGWHRVKRGLHAPNLLITALFSTKTLPTTRKPGITLANYQENRLRQFHGVLDDYVGGKYKK